MHLYKMQTGSLASKYHFFLDFWTYLSAKKLINNVGIKMLEYKISVFTVCFTHPCQMSTRFTCRKNKSTCAYKEWKLLILTFPHFSFLYLIILSSPPTEILWKRMRHSRTTVVDIRGNTLWKQPLSIQKRISIAYTKITRGHPFNCKVGEKLR